MSNNERNLNNSIIFFYSDNISELAKDYEEYIQDQVDKYVDSYYEDWINYKKNKTVVRQAILFLYL